MKKIYAGLVALVLAVVGVVAFATASSAHSPNVSADCNGLVVTLNSYGVANVNVQVNGATVDSYQVSGSDTRTYSFGQEGATSTYSVSIDETQDGDQYDSTEAGQVGPCGEVTPPTETPTVPTETPTVPTETPTVPTETPTPQPPVTPEPPVETPQPPVTPPAPPVDTETRHVYTCTSHTVITLENGVEVDRETNTFESTCAPGSTTPNPSEEGF